MNLPLSRPSDRNLLLGILALQLNFVTREQLVVAMNAWLLQKNRPLEEILLDGKALSDDTMKLLQALVAKHLELHDGDAQQSLQSLSSIGDLRQDLQLLADPDVNATLIHVANPTKSIDATLDHEAIRTDAICDQFVHCWREGQRPKIEDYLRQVSESTRGELLEMLLREEVQLRRIAGHVARAEEYETRFPQYREFILRAFEALRSIPPNATGAYRRSRESRSSHSTTRFRVIRPHAKGGLGEVFVARDTELNREVALKEIQERFAENSDIRTRFLLEAEVTGGLEHPGIVPIYGLGQYADGRPFYAMRFIKGDSLKDAIERFHKQNSGVKDFTTGEVGVEFRNLLGRFIDVCEAIEYAHSRGVLHRDLKPGNIMLGKFGETLVVDWGLAKVVGRTDKHLATDEATLLPESDSKSAPTQMGSAIGTPAFMSPEQAAGHLDKLGPASDVYSLGATLYYLLINRPPVTDRNLDQILAKVQRGEFAKPREVNPSLPRPLEAICLKAMSRDYRNRYDSPMRLARDIERWLADEPIEALVDPISIQIGRWLRRHQVFVASTGIALLACVIASFAIAWIAASYGKKQKEQRIALSELYTRSQLSLGQNHYEQRRIATSFVNFARALQTTEDNGLKESILRVLVNKVTQNGLLQSLPIQRPGFGAENPRFSADGLRVFTTGADQSAWDSATGAFQQTINDHFTQISPDGRFIVALRGNQGRILEANSLSLLGQFDPGDWRGAIAFSPDANRFITREQLGDNLTLVIRDSRSGNRVGSPIPFQPFGKSFEFIGDFAFSADGTRVFTTGEHSLHVWDSSSGRSIANVKVLEEIKETNTNGKVRLRVPSYGTRVATLTEDGIASIWEGHDGAALSSHFRHEGLFETFVFSPDGQSISVQESDSKVAVVPLWKEAVKRIISLPGERIDEVIFSPDGRTIAVRTSTGKYFLQRGRRVTPLTDSSDRYSEGLFSPDATLFACGNAAKQIRVYNVCNSQLAIPPYTYEANDSFFDLQFDLDGACLAVAVQNAPARVMRLPQLRLERFPETVRGTLTNLPDWANLGRLYIAGSGVYESSSHKLVCVLPDGVSKSSTPTSGDKASTHIARGFILSGDGKGVLLDCVSGEVWPSFDFHPEDTIFLPTTNVAISPDGELLAWVPSGRRNEVAILRRSENSPMTSLVVDEGGVEQLRFTSDSRALIASAKNQTGDRAFIRIFESDGKAMISRFYREASRIDRLQLSPGGRFAMVKIGDECVSFDCKSWQVTTFTDFGQTSMSLQHVDSIEKVSVKDANGGIRIVDLNTGLFLGDALEPAGRLDRLCSEFSTSGSFLAISRGRSILIVDAKDPSRILKTRSMSRVISSLAVSPDETLVAVGSIDGYVSLVSLDSNKHYEDLIHLEDRVHRVIFSPDGKTLAAVDTDGNLCIADTATGVPLSGLERIGSGSFDGEIEFLDDDSLQVLVKGIPMRRFGWRVTVPSIKAANAYAQLACGMNLSNPDIATPLSHPEQVRLWQELLSGDPDWSVRQTSERVNNRSIYHHQAALLAEEDKDWYAVVFHLRRLLLRRVSIPDLHTKLAIAEEKLKAELERPVTTSLDVIIRE